MNLSAVSRKVRPIGLDIGSRVVKATQLDATGTRLIASARFPRTTRGSPVLGADEANLIATALPRLGFSGSDVVLAMHPSKLLAAVLDLPPASSGAPVADIARAELGRIQRVDADSLEIGMWELPAGPRAKASEAPPSMVVACKRDDAEAIIAPLDSAGLVCVRVDVPGPALVRAVTTPRSQAASVLLDLGASAASAFVLLDRTPIFERRVPDAGLELLFRQITETFGLDNAGAEHIIAQVGCNTDDKSPGCADIASLILAHADLLVKELRTSLAYVAHRYPDLSIGQIQVIGGGSSIPGLVERIASESQIAAHPVGWAELGVAPSTGSFYPADLALSLGLSRPGLNRRKEAA